MAYTEQVWADGDPTKPVSAARLQHIEDGLAAIANGGSITYNGVTFLTPDQGGWSAFDRLKLAPLASGDATGAIDFAVLNGLIGEIPSSGGKVLFGGGTYIVSAALPWPDKTSFEGLGRDATTIQLAANANDDVFRSSSFESLTGGNTTGGISDSSIRNVTIDGNQANQSFGTQTVGASSNGQNLNALTGSKLYLSTTANLPSSGSLTLTTTSGVQTVLYTALGSDGGGAFVSGCSGGAGLVSTGQHAYQRGYGIRAYGRDLRLEHVNVTNCFLDGVYTEWATGSASSGTSQMESSLIGVKAYKNVRNGFTLHGSHDSSLVNCWAFQNSQNGFETGNSATYYFTACHAWGAPQVISFSFHTGCFASNCVGEVTSATNSRGILFAGGAGATSSWDGGWIIGAQGGGDTGIEISNGTTNTKVRTLMLGVGAAATGNPILFTSDGGYNDIEFDAHYSASSSQPLASAAPNGNTRLVARPGRNCTALPVDTDHWATKGSATGIAPSATLNTFGTASVIAASGTNLRPAVSLTQLSLVSGGTFASETLTARVTATYHDGTTATFTKTFTVTATTYTLTTGDFYTLQANNKQIVSLALDCESTIGSSAATIGYFYAGQR